MLCFLFLAQRGVLLNTDIRLIENMLPKEALNILFGLLEEYEYCEGSVKVAKLEGKLGLKEGQATRIRAPITNMKVSIN